MLHIPVVGGQITTVLHGAPAGPGLLLVLVGADVPDALAPDDVLQSQGAAVLHDPFGNLSAGQGSTLQR